MQIRIYRHPVIRYPLPRHFIEDADRIGRRQAEIKGTHDFVKWFTTWYLCARAFVHYYAKDEDHALDLWAPVHESAWNTGWPQYELATVNGKPVHVVPCQVREKFSLGSTLSARLSSGIFERSKGETFVVAALDIPDVDIVGWLPRSDIPKCKARGAFYLREPVLRPMSECPMAHRDNKHWFI